MTNSGLQPLIYFSSLELENVRCFGEHQVLELTNDQGRPARWTLLLGDNGVGKTTLLQCLAWMRPVPFGAQKEDKPKKIQPALTNEENEVLDSLLRAGNNVTLNLRATLSVYRSLTSTDSKKSALEKKDGLHRNRHPYDRRR